MDLTKLIVKTQNKNKRNLYLADLNKEQGIKVKKDQLITNDPVFIRSIDEIKDIKISDRMKSATDFALLCGVKQDDESHYDKLGLFSVNLCLRTPKFDDKGPVTLKDIYKVNTNGEVMLAHTSTRKMGICPVLRLDIQEVNKTMLTNPQAITIEEKKLKDGTSYPILKMGQYPKSFAEDNISSQLEKLYNNGNLLDGLSLTGKLFSFNHIPENEDDIFFACRHLPEFEYNGQKYVRVISNKFDDIALASDSSFILGSGEVAWVKVEPITFEITNWRDLPKSINPKGKNRAQFIEIETEQAIVGGMPFNPYVNSNANMWQNSFIRAFLNGQKIDEMDRNAQAKDVSRWDFSNAGFLNQAFNLSSQPITEFTIPDHEYGILPDAFKDCKFLEKVVIPKHVKKINKEAFKDCNFKFAYSDKNLDALVFSKSLPENQKDITNIISIDALNDSFYGFDYALMTHQDDFEKLIHLANLLKKVQIKMPINLASIFIKNPDYYNIISNYDFKFFRNEVMPYVDNSQMSYKDYNTIFKMAINLGCFSKQKMLDKNMHETQTSVGQMSSTFLANALKNGYISIGVAEEIFSNIDPSANVSQNFIKFINLQGEHKKLANLELLLDLNKKNKNLFIKTLRNFDKIVELRNTLDANGKPIKLSWRDAILKYYHETKYVGVTEENLDIGRLFAQKGLSQEAFDLAISARDKAKEKNTLHHILGETLKEESLIESIEFTKNDTAKLLQGTKPILDQLYEKQFTYEMLDKYDPQNSILGLYCSCCATITSSYYGKQITFASISSDDVQSMVVRNISGEIVAKGTMYLNRKKGYVVINDFEINEQYKQHEINDGYYDEILSDPKEEKERDLIFNAFLRGINAFVKKYDEKNPDTPIKYVTVGHGYNRLKRQCETFEQSTKLFDVPAEYKFKDAEEKQYVLYDRQKMLKEKLGGKEQ